MAYEYDRELLIQLESDSNKFFIVKDIQKKATALNHRCDDQLRGDTAINHIMTNTEPNIPPAPDEEGEAIKEMYIYVTDKEVMDAVYDSYFESKGKRNLIYLYNDIVDEYKKSRVRILTRYLWYRFVRPDSVRLNERMIMMSDFNKDINTDTPAKKSKRGSRKKLIPDEKVTTVSETTVEVVADTVESTIEDTVEVTAEPIVEETIEQAETIVEPIVEEVPAVEEIQVVKEKLTTGKMLNLVNVWCYPTSVSSKSNRVINGTYYVWDDTVITNRVRICETSDDIGKPNKICGWISADLIK